MDRDDDFLVYYKLFGNGTVDSLDRSDSWDDFDDAHEPETELL
jgi:hypothetical protein